MINHQPSVPKGQALRRIVVLSSLISSLIRSGRASLQSLGTHMQEKTDLESRIKKAKRWISNKWTDTQTHFLPYILPIVHSMSQSGQLLLAIDGSTVGKDCMALMVSLIWKKRAIPLCWVVRKAPKGHFPEQMHCDLLKAVATLLRPIVDSSCQIILLGDGEFDGTDLQAHCRKAQWKYVLRTAKDTLIADEPDMQGALKMGAVSPEPGQKSWFMPQQYITAKGYGPVAALFWHHPKYKDPLYLLTNFDSAIEAEAFYRKRYRIETFFGDIKSRGFHIHKTRICDPERLHNLLIVAALAFILAIIFEPQARNSKFLSQFCRKDRIESLSIFQLGLRGLNFYIDNLLLISFQFSKNFPKFISVRQ